MNLPRKRTILAWHRWMGLISAIFLVVLSITGLALNHTERLGLDTVQIRSSWILKRYGMKSSDAIKSYRIGKSDTASHLADTIFYNQKSVTTGGVPVSILETEQITAIATNQSLIYLTPDGEFIETVSAAQLPFNTITAIGQNEGKPVLATDAGLYSTDENWIEFTPYEGSYTIDPLITTELNEAQRIALIEAFQGDGISLYRLLLDLHSGRLFGWGGRTLMDLTAVAVLLLVSSGIGGWLRKSRRNKPA